MNEKRTELQWQKLQQSISVRSEGSRRLDFKLEHGAFAENILVEGMEVHTLPIGTRLKIGEASVEVTQIGKECHYGCAIREKTGDCVMPREGIFVKVIRSGHVRTGDEIAVCAEQ